MIKEVRDLQLALFEEDRLTKQFAGLLVERNKLNLIFESVNKDLDKALEMIEEAESALARALLEDAK